MINVHQRGFSPYFEVTEEVSHEGGTRAALTVVAVAYHTLHRLAGEGVFDAAAKTRAVDGCHNGGS